MCLEKSHSALCPNCYENSISLCLWRGRRDWCLLRGFVKLALPPPQRLGEVRCKMDTRWEKHNQEAELLEVLAD